MRYLPDHDFSRPTNFPLWCSGEILRWAMEGEHLPDTDSTELKIATLPESG